MDALTKCEKLYFWPYSLTYIEFIQSCFCAQLRSVLHPPISWHRVLAPRGRMS